MGYGQRSLLNSSFKGHQLSKIGRAWAQVAGRVTLRSQSLACVSALRISGNAASDKNIKDGVCAQIEKNFARAKWKVCSP